GSSPPPPATSRYGIASERDGHRAVPLVVSGRPATSFALHLPPRLPMLRAVYGELQVWELVFREVDGWESRPLTCARRGSPRPSGGTPGGSLHSSKAPRLRSSSASATGVRASARTSTIGTSRAVR